MKEKCTKYTCDNCSKKKVESDSVVFPYHENWAYIYNFTGKVLQSHYPGVETNIGRFELKDKHFCSKDCLAQWIMEVIIAAQTETKNGTQVSKEEQTVIAGILGLP